MWPQAGRATGPAVGRASRQESFWPVMLVGERGISGSAWSKDVTGVNQVRFPLESRCRPVLIDCPDRRSGRQGPASEISLQCPSDGVKGRPPLQLDVFEICQPPITRSIARLTLSIYFLPLPKGNSYTVLTTKTCLRLKSSGP